MTEATQALLPVTQADRKAAAPFANCLSDMQDIFDGKADGLPVVQAFARHRISHSLPETSFRLFEQLRDLADDTLMEAGAVRYNAGDIEKVQDALIDMGSLARDALDALAALTPSPCPGDGMREALADIFAAWDKHCDAVSRMNAARPDVLGHATRAERQVYDERYFASEDAKRDWFAAMHRFIKNPVTRAALTPSALSGDAGEG